jgi:molybdopterin synthase sulfurtransferase
MFRPDLPRWRHLVAPPWLARVITGEPVLAAPSQGWRLFEVGFGGLDLFGEAHIPGAGYIDTRDMECEPLWNKVCNDALLALLLSKGVRYDTTVVLYARNTLAAARAAHLMLYAGVRDVRILDGGLAAWQAGGFPTTSGVAEQFAPADSFGTAFPARPDYLINMAQARALVDSGDGTLVSTRTWNEHIGKTSGYSYITACGEIPGARWGRAGNDDDVNCMSEYHEADGTMKPASEILSLWNKAGIEQDGHTAFYCGTGWRASLAFFYAWLMEWESISVYDGGWCEWSRDPNNPVVRRVASAHH